MLRFDINLLFTVINLLILFVLLKKFLFGRVHKILEERQAEIDASFEKAELANKEAEQNLTEAKEEAKQQRELRDKAIADAKKEASEAYDKIVADANVKADEIVEKAGIKAEQEAQDRIQEAQAQIADLVYEAVEKLEGAQGNVSDGKLFDSFLGAVADEKKAEDSANE
ncbi:MAG: ATP synthase F0 subunit B [Lachnospiraceae bacterium]|nr:ATP synthase F0 subunit B [Lachnospiraceae bacterium]